MRQGPSGLIVKERHSADVPEATGINVYLAQDDNNWRYRSKLYHQLSSAELSQWRFLVGYVYGIRLGDITDSFLASEVLSWKGHN